MIAQALPNESKYRVYSECAYHNDFMQAKEAVVCKFCVGMEQKTQEECHSKWQIAHKNPSYCFGRIVALKIVFFGVFAKAGNIFVFLPMPLEKYIPL